MLQYFCTHGTTTATTSETVCSIFYKATHRCCCLMQLVVLSERFRVKAFLNITLNLSSRKKNYIYGRMGVAEEGTKQAGVICITKTWGARGHHTMQHNAVSRRMT